MSQLSVWPSFGASLTEHLRAPGCSAPGRVLPRTCEAKGQGRSRLPCIFSRHAPCSPSRSLSCLAGETWKTLRLRRITRLVDEQDRF